MPSYIMNLLLIIYIQNINIYIYIIVFGCSAKQKQDGRRGGKRIFKRYNELALSLRSRWRDSAKLEVRVTKHMETRNFWGGG